MSIRTVARIAEEVQPVRNWIAFAVPNGQVVHKGRYYFAWSGGHFVGAYDTLDDAVESLAFRNKKTHRPRNCPSGVQRGD